jgi:hypothetical protein
MISIFRSKFIDILVLLSKGIDMFNLFSSFKTDVKTFMQDIDARVKAVETYIKTLGEAAEDKAVDAPAPVADAAYEAPAPADVPPAA